MNDSTPTVALKELLDRTREAVEGKIDQIPDFQLMAVSEVSPQKILVKITECSQSLDATEEILSQIPVIRAQTRDAVHACRVNSIPYEEDEAVMFSDWLQDMRDSLEIQRRRLSGHMTVLRGQLSALSKNPSFADQVPAED